MKTYLLQQIQQTTDSQATSSGASNLHTQLLQKEIKEIDDVLGN